VLTPVLTPVLALAMALVVVVVMVMKAYSSEGYVLLGLAAAHLSNSSTWDQWDQLSVLPPTVRSECATGFCRRQHFMLAEAPIHAYERARSALPVTCLLEWLAIAIGWPHSHHPME